jgi:hypothetical protein
MVFLAIFPVYFNRAKPILGNPFYLRRQITYSPKGELDSLILNLNPRLKKINLLKNINVTQDIKKTENLVRKVTRLARYNNVNQVTENLENLITQENNISTTEFKTEIQNLKNLINVSKSIDISKIDNVKISQISLISENIEKLSKINQVNNLIFLLKKVKSYFKILFVNNV